MQQLVFKVAASVDFACDFLGVQDMLTASAGHDEQAAMELICRHEVRAKRTCEFAIATGVPALIESLTAENRELEL